MALWLRGLKHRSKSWRSGRARRTFLTGPERLESRQMMATWSGDIPDGTVWSSGLNEITGNVHIPSGVTLTIQPGAVIKFDTGREFKIDVDGRLMAQGTA